MREIIVTQKITDRESTSFGLYLQEVSREKRITIEEETEYAKKIRIQKDEKAVEKMVRANLRFVITVAKQYQNMGLPLQDLVNEGNIGLIQAAWRFDETRGFKFISFAVKYISGSILTALMNDGKTIRIPGKKIQEMKRLNKTISRLEQDLERDPSVEEISEAAEITRSEVSRCMAIPHYVSSLDKKMDIADARVTAIENGTADEDTNIALRSLQSAITTDNSEIDAPEYRVLQESLATDIQRVVDVHCYRSLDSKIIQMYFGLNGTEPVKSKEIGNQFEITPERVRQIKEKFTRRCRGIKASRELLQKYLD